MYLQLVMFYKKKKFFKDFFQGFATHIYLSLGKPGDRDLLVERISEQQELQVVQFLLLAY